MVPHAWDSPRPLRWYAGSIVSCGLGMGCKEVMAGAPLLVMFYDWTFRTSLPPAPSI